MNEFSHNSFRFSISWSRLINKDQSINQKAVDFYNDVINTMIENDVKPFINLFHFDMPMYLQEIGGWENREVVSAYQHYAKTCFELFGDRVKMWFTHNEPIVPVECGYLGHYHYPCVVDFKRAVQVGYHIMLSSALAIMEYKKLKQGGQIGIIINLTPSYPRSNSEEDLAASNIADLLLNRSFLDPSVYGEFPGQLVEFIKEQNLMPEYSKEDIDIIKNNTVDLLGVNYYQPRRVKSKESEVKENEPLTPESFFDFYDMPGKKINPHRGWEIYEKGIYDLSINIRDNYKNIPFFIEDLYIIKNSTVDLLGVNYYQPRRVKAKENKYVENDTLTPESFFDFYDMPGKKINPHRGWEIYEKGIYDLSINIRDNYKNIPFFISENGMGVEGEEKFKVNGQINDDYRIEFIKEHLKWIHKALEEGCNVKGYHLWTFMDNWSWLNSYKNRYGFIEIDLDDNYKRTPKKSAYWFKNVIENSGF